MENKKILIASPERHEKSWGHELWINNNDGYCGKLLMFKENGQFSMHYHLLKNETWYVQEGEFELLYIDTDNAEQKVEILYKGAVIDIPIGQPHQLKCLSKNGTIFEVSDKHYESDSYRVKPGDSQK